MWWKCSPQGTQAQECRGRFCSVPLSLATAMIIYLPDLQGPGLFHHHSFYLAGQFSGISQGDWLY